MTDKIIIWYGKHAYYGWYDPNTDLIFLTGRVNESNVEYILNHEILHMTLNNFINYEASYKLENISLALWLIENDRFDFSRKKKEKRKNILRRFINWLRSV